MKKQEIRAGRRAFLAGTAQALVASTAISLVTETAAQSAIEESDSRADSKEILPGEAGYRDPGAYGSEAEGLAE